MSIQQDILKALKKGDDGEKAEFPFVKVPHYDATNGVYRILGGLVADTVQFRHGTNRNVAKTVGLRVLNVTTQEELFVTKDEAIALARQYNLQNAYIRTVAKKDVKTKEDYLSRYVYPYPAGQESFTQDDRLHFVYRMDESGKRIKPLRLAVAKEECSTSLWGALQSDYQRRLPRSLKGKRAEEQELAIRAKELRAQIKEGRYHVINPFSSEVVE